MAQNTQPIFTRVPAIKWVPQALTASNTAKDGTGTVMTVFQADSTNGSYLSTLSFRAAGTNVATVARVFINNGGTNSVAANNILYNEITLSATTLSEVASTANYVLPMNIALPPGYKINVTIGTTVAAGYYISAIGGDY